MRYTTLSEVTLKLRFTGRIGISLFRIRKDPATHIKLDELTKLVRDSDLHAPKLGRRFDAHREQLFACEKNASDEGEAEISFTAPLMYSRPESAGILGFTITLMNESASLVEGEWRTRQAPCKQVALSIVSTTFQRERYIKDG